MVAASGYSERALGEEPTSTVTGCHEIRTSGRSVKNPFLASYWIGGGLSVR